MLHNCVDCATKLWSMHVVRKGARLIGFFQNEYAFNRLAEEFAYFQG